MAVDIAKTGPGGDFLSDASDLQVAEWSCRALIQSLLKDSLESTENETLARAGKMLEAGADGLMQRIAEVADLDEKIDAYSNVEFLVEACLSIGFQSKNPGDTKGKVGRVMRLLTELYVSDPVGSGETTAAQLLHIVQQQFGTETPVGPSTLFRARQNLGWRV